MKCLTYACVMLSNGNGNIALAKLSCTRNKDDVNYANCIHRMFHLVFCVTPIVTAFSEPLVTFHERIR